MKKSTASGKCMTPASNIWSNYSDLTRPHPKWWFDKGALKKWTPFKIWPFCMFDFWEFNKALKKALFMDTGSNSLRRPYFLKGGLGGSPLRFLWKHVIPMFPVSVAFDFPVCQGWSLRATDHGGSKLRGEQQGIGKSPCLPVYVKTSKPPIFHGRAEKHHFFR